MVGKNIAIATIFLAIIAFMALAFRPGSVGMVGGGQGGGYSMGGENGGGNWGGGGEHDGDDD